MKPVMIDGVVLDLDTCCRESADHSPVMRLERHRVGLCLCNPRTGCPLYLIDEETGHFHEFCPDWNAAKKLGDRGGDSVWVSVPFHASRYELSSSVHDLIEPEPVPPGSLE